MTDKKFLKLLEPGSIGRIKTRNRIIKSAAGLWYWGKGDNTVTEKVKCLYEAIAKGGAGLIIMESPGIEKGGRSFRLDDERQRRQVADLNRMIHAHDCPVFVQFTSMANWNIIKSPDFDTRGPSPVHVFSEMDNHDYIPRELTIPEIEEIVDKFANNAVWAREAGFDGVEINSSCSHLLHTFLSPFWNKRNDAYGGSLENRTRFLTSLIVEMKKRAGTDFPVTCLINGLETGKLIDVEDNECLTLEESLVIAQTAEKAGADALQVRSQWIGRHDASFLTDHICYPEPPVPLSSFPRELDMNSRGAGANVPLAAAVKKVVSIPVITVGRFDPEIGERALEEGRADFIAMTRRLFADPDLPNKLAAGRFNDIAPCTSCTQCKDEDGPRRCRINAALGSDLPYEIKAAEQKKKVVVIGGGPGGMEAARIAAIRGHDVTLLEKSTKLGGLLSLAAMVKGTDIEDLPAFIGYYEEQLTKLGVKIHLGKEATPVVVNNIKPDVLIIAGGGIATLPDIPGINGSNVVSNVKLHGILKFFLRFLSPKIIRALTKIWMPLGKRVVIIGGGIQGCELAEFLVKRGKRVTIVDSADTLGKDMVSHLKLQLFWWFRKKGVVMMPGVKPVKVTAKGLTVHTKQGYNQIVEADSIVTALPLEPNKELFCTFDGSASEVYTIGDCCSPGLIVDAVAQGWAISKTL